MHSVPFLIYALPRSRTFWLSQFLTVGGWCCGHEEVRHMRSMTDVRDWLAQPYTGSAETSAALAWRVPANVRPDLRVVTVRRRLDEVMGSLDRAWPGWDIDRLAAILRRADRRLDQIEREASNVLSVRFDDLRSEDACAAVFRHCTGQNLPHDWWSHMAPLRLSGDLDMLARYTAAHRRQLERFGKLAVAETANILRLRRLEREASALPPVVIAEEPFADLWRDGQAAITEHQAEAGPRDDVQRQVNAPLLQRLADNGFLQVVTARAAEQIVGYHLAVISPSLENANHSVGTQGPFFLRRPWRGIGPRLAREAIRRLLQKGVGEVVGREGTLASGPKLGALYRRWGATDFGRLYRIGRDVMEAI